MEAEEEAKSSPQQLIKSANSESWKSANKKKRPISSPEVIGSNIKKRQTFIKDYWLSKPIDIHNSFEKLQPDDDSRQEAVNNSEIIGRIKIQKPPPIFVSGVEDLSPLKNLLDEISDKAYILKILPNNEVKIQPNLSENYVKIIEELKKRNTEFYTYQSKKDKSYKTVLRHIHPSVSPEEIKTAIEEYNHKVLRITNIRDRYTQKPLPIFFVEIQTNDNNKTIYNIDKLLNTVVQFEPPYKKREILQCTKCQGFGHTKNYCFRSPACVKCAEKHLTKDCSIKQKTDEVKCINCSGNHPASYKGCNYRKQLQQKLFPTLREKTISRTTQNYIPTIDKMTKPKMTYADVTSRQPKQTGINSEGAYPVNQNKTNTCENVNNYKLEEMMLQLMTRMDTILNLLTSLVNKIQL